MFSHVEIRDLFQEMKEEKIDLDQEKIELFEINYEFAKESVEDVCIALGLSWSEKDKTENSTTFVIVNKDEEFEVLCDYHGPDAFHRVDEANCPTCENCGGIHSDDPSEYEDEKKSEFVIDLLEMVLDKFEIDLVKDGDEFEYS